jgi:hypothetical protein
MKNISLWLVFATILFGVGMRLNAYGDLRLSVANRDTQSYIDSSRVDLLSWEAFTSYRPYTTNVIYKTFTPGDGYRIRAISDGETSTIKRKIDRGFLDIAILQSVVSMIGWACLAWSFSSQLKNGAVRMLSAAVIILFGFTPQVSDWDSVLGAESLSISLFVFSYAILIWLAFAYSKETAIDAKKIAGFVVLFTLLFFWVFTRDVNAYPLIFLIVFILGLYIIPRFRRTKFLLLASLLILAVFFVGITSARQRPLWKLALTHVWVSDILPSQSNMQYFTEKGMPEYETPEYYEWFDGHAPAAYMQFLAAHPVYTTHKFFKDQDLAFQENMQPHFKANELPQRQLLIIAGNYLHPKSGTTFFIILVLLFMLWNQFLFQKKQEALPWLWLTTWTFLVASGTMFFSIFGDSWGLVRHALSSTITYRLLMWMLLIILIDFSMQREKADQAK